MGSRVENPFVAGRKGARGINALILWGMRDVIERWAYLLAGAVSNLAHFLL
jgi:hypothetical protein